MARREDKGLSLDPPDDWVDRTMITYAAPPRPGEKTSPTLVVTRDTLKDNDTLQTYADRHLLELSGAMPGFDLLDSGGRTMGEGDYPAIFIRFRWSPPFGVVEQSAIFVETLGAAGREVRVFSTTALADKVATDGPRFEGILKTVRLAPPKVPPGPPSGPAPSSIRNPAHDLTKDLTPFALPPMPGPRKR